MEAIPNYPYCFVCGDKNKRGLKVAFYYDDGKAKAEYIPSREYEGYKDILHGGIISSLLDEVMIQSIIARGILTFTIQMEVKFKTLAKIGEKILLEGHIIQDKGKIIVTEGNAFKLDGTIIATAKGKYFRPEGERKKELEKKRK
jgi:acyl-coenzyme A thioesterase PaaI-like protein